MKKRKMANNWFYYCKQFDVLVTIIDAILPNHYDELMVKSDFATITKSQPLLASIMLIFVQPTLKICVLFIFHGVSKWHLHLCNVLLI